MSVHLSWRVHSRLSTGLFTVMAIVAFILFVRNMQKAV